MVFFLLWLQHLVLLIELVAVLEGIEAKYHVFHCYFHVQIEHNMCSGMPSTQRSLQLTYLLGELLMAHRMMLIRLISNNWLKCNLIFNVLL